MKKISLLFAALQLLLFSYGQSGKPDLSFGNGGFLTNNVPSRTIVVQGDGKIISAGAGSKNGVAGFLVARYNTDGSRDNSFGGDGSIVSNFGLVSCFPTSVIVQPDGKVLVAGFGTNTGPLLYVEILARFNADGSVDNSFNGTGSVQLGSLSDANYLALQSNGKIIMAGLYNLTRFTSSGMIDSSFATNGRYPVRFVTLPYAVAVRDDKIIIAGFNNGEGLATSNQNFGLARFNANGTLDSSFDGNGIVSTAIEGGNAVAQSLSIRPDGKLIVAGSLGYNGDKFAIARYNTDGSLDNSLDADGILMTDFASKVSAQGSDKILAAGINKVARYNANGSPDASFGNNGQTATVINASAVAVRNDRFYVLGQNSNAGILGVYYLGAAAQHGLYYKYFEGTWNTLPDFNALAPVKTGNTDNIDVSVRTPGRNDNYAFIWRGYINITTPGAYTFETVSDDGSKLYFNRPYGVDSIALVTNDGLHAPTAASAITNIPAAGIYPITITYFEKDGGEAMQLYWTGPGITRQLVPNAAFTTASTNQPGDNGLSYKYYEGSWNTLPDFTTLTPVKTGSSPNIDINERTPGRNDNFAFVWEGSINVPSAGNYTFTTISDDGSKLYFNSLYVPSATATVNNDGLHAATSVSGTVNVPAAGAYPISITFFEKDGDESMKVYWSGPGIPTQLIPNIAFLKTVTPQPTTAGLSYKMFGGPFSMLPDFNKLVPEKTGSSANIDISVRGSRTDNLAFLWEGYIKIETPGLYTFETISDDGSKLYFNTLYNPNAVATVDNDGVHAAVAATGSVNIPTAGVFPISVTYFERDGGESMEVYWTGPGIPRQLIPNSAFVQGMPSTGLNYKYYEGEWNALPDFNALTPVKTGLTPNLNLDVRTPGRNDNFAMLWEGYLTVPVPGNYTIELVSDDGSKFYFNNFYSTYGSWTIGNDGVHPATSVSTNLNISSTYPIAVTYFEKDGGETLQLYWTGPGISRQLIPNSAFTPRNALAPGTTVNRDANGLQATTAADMLGSSITKVYPNPFAERFTISFYNDKPTDDISVAIYDLNGKQLYNQYAGRFAQGKASLMVNLKERQIKDGIYMVTINKNGLRSTTIKLIKQH